MGRDANAPRGIATNVEWRTTHGQNRRRPAAAAAWRTRKVIGIVRTTVDAIVRIVRESQLGCVCFSQDDRTGRSQFCHDGGILFRNITSPALRPAGTHDAPGVEGVLDGNGYAVQFSHFTVSG